MSGILYLITLLLCLLGDNLVSSDVKEASTESNICSLISEIINCIVANKACPNEHIRFFLYNREILENNNAYEILQSNETSIKLAPFKQNTELIVLFHGYTGNKDYSPNRELRPALLTKDDYNIISVDWSPLARSPCYIQAAINTDVVGYCTAKLLQSLFSLRSESVSCDRTHVIGFSLGAHCAGDTGKHLIKMGCKLPWITGLDPALPLFGTIKVNEEVLWKKTKMEFFHIIQGNKTWNILEPEVNIFSEKAGPENILETSDAMFVDIIHTNVGDKGQYGPHGHVDFYINNGHQQPGCLSNASCDHVRAVEFYRKTILGDLTNKGTPCELDITGVILGVKKEVCRPSNTFTMNHSLITTGINVSKKVRGTYQVSTEDNPK